MVTTHIPTLIILIVINILVLKVFKFEKKTRKNGDMYLD